MSTGLVVAAVHAAGVAEAQRAVPDPTLGKSLKAKTLRLHSCRLNTCAWLLLSPTGLVLAATEGVVPAHDLESLAQGPEKGNLAPLAINPVHGLDPDLAGPSLVLNLASLAPARLTGSLVPRAAPRGSLIGILVADQRKSLPIKSLAAAPPPLLKMEKRSLQRNHPTVPHPHRKVIADPTQEKSARPPAQSPAHGPIPGPDQPLRISKNG